MTSTINELPNNFFFPIEQLCTECRTCEYRFTQLSKCCICNHLISSVDMLYCAKCALKLFKCPSCGRDRRIPTKLNPLPMPPLDST